MNKRNILAACGPPYFVCGNVMLYHGDCREMLAKLPPNVFAAVITDPVWPDTTLPLPGAENPESLFADAASYFPALASRLAVHLGCDSDPRFLLGVPPALKFFRVAWLRYARCHYKGRLLYTGDVAYLFGTPPPSRKGAHVIPGEFCATSVEKEKTGHPCPRHGSHVDWLLRWWGGGPVLDPFAGSGTTLAAAIHAGLPALGIEVKEEYCEMARERIASAAPLFAREAK